MAPTAHLPSSSSYFNTLKTAGLDSVVSTVQYELATPNKQGVRFFSSWSSKGADILTAEWGDILLGKVPVETGVPKMVGHLNDTIKQNS